MVLTVPYCADLQRVRRTVAAVDRELLLAGQVATFLGVKERAARYALQAAEFLGAIRRDGQVMEVTPLGSRWLATTPASPEEAQVLADAIRTDDRLKTWRPWLVDGDTVDRHVLEEWLVETSGLARSTIKERIPTLIGWRRALSSAGTSTSSRKQLAMFAGRAGLAPALRQDLLRDNPWWLNKPGKPLPQPPRVLVRHIHRRLDLRLAPIVLVRGPRQVGKTVAQRQVIEDLLSRGVEAHRILRVQCDETPELLKLSEPILRIADWFEAEVLGETFNEAARADRRAYLLFDEVQNLPDWSVQLKHLVDACDLHVVITGSSALRLKAGQDSLAGRITSLDVGTLSLSEVAAVRGLGRLETLLDDNGVESLRELGAWQQLRELGRSQAVTRDQAFAAFCARGGYPLVHRLKDVPWSDLANQLNEMAIRRVVQQDLRVGLDRGQKRDAGLLFEIFRLGCRYVGQAPTLGTLQRELWEVFDQDVSTSKLREYLDFLDHALLLRSVRPLELRTRRTRGASKLCLADHGLRASFLGELVPLSSAASAESAHMRDLAGRVAESIVGITLLGLSGLQVDHLPARRDEPEVDFVITVGTRRIPIEVKYRRQLRGSGVTQGLRSFLSRETYNAGFGVLVTQGDEPNPSPDIVALPLSSLLLVR